MLPSKLPSHPSLCISKRAIDLLIAAPLLFCAIPFMAIVSVALRMDGVRPVLFKQIRVGAFGQQFTLQKLRTMYDLVGSDGTALPDGQRISWLGHRLRNWSVDEIPQLWNVLRGDMSLVGPRPLLPEYLALYNDRQVRRLQVKPGITGLAQVNGRNGLRWEEKFELDVWYVDNWSLRLDLKILALTIRQVLRRDGITAEGHATAPRFAGDSSVKNAVSNAGDENGAATSR